MTPLRVAMLGTGFIAEFRSQVYARTPGAELVAVLGRDPDRTRAVADRHGIPHAATDYDALFAGPAFDVVDICLPNHLHLAAAERCAAEGKHLICEKPLGRTAEEARAMLAAAEDASVIHAYGENWIFSPDMLEIEARLKQGVIGRPLTLRGREGHFGPHTPWFYDRATAGGGALLDMGCHVIGAFQRLIPGATREVFCSADTLHHDTDCEDNALGIMRFESGVVGQVEASWTVRGGMAVTLEIWGDEGMLQYDRTALAQPIKIFARRATDAYVMEKAESDRGWLFPMVEEYRKYGYQGEIEHFLDAIRAGREPDCTFREGVEVNRVIDAMYASARERVWKDVA
jgi:predicted dehydrogenase